MSTTHNVSPETIRAALNGYKPFGHPLSMAELGIRLASHRPGSRAGQPYSRAAISLYAKYPEQQSAAFVTAFRAWIIAETAKRPRPKYLRPCLSPDPRKRLMQLAALTAQTQHEIEAAA